MKGNQVWEKLVDNSLWIVGCIIWFDEFELYACHSTISNLIINHIGHAIQSSGQVIVDLPYHHKSLSN